jgi:hypothetical protein
MDFYVAFPSNTDLTQNAELIVRVQGAPGATGTVTGGGPTQSFRADTTGFTAIPLSSYAILNAWDTVQTRGVRIHTDDSMTVVAENGKPFSMHVAMLLPASPADTAFTIMSGGYDRPGSFLAIAARQAATTVTIAPSATAGARAANAPFTIVLNAGDAYQLEATDSTGDLTGSRIHADNPISVFGGHMSANVPSGAGYAGFLWTSIPPHDRIAGTDFIAFPLTPRSGYRLRVLALQSNTQLTSTGISGMATTLSVAGQVVEARTTTAARITSDKPVLVAQLAEGYTVDGSGGNPGADPCLALLTPVGRFTRAAAFAMPVAQAPLRYVNVVVPTAAAGGIKLNGATPAVTFSAIGATGYSGAAIPLSTVANRLTGTAGFGAQAYGWDTLPGANGFCFPARSSF